MSIRPKTHPDSTYAIVDDEGHRLIIDIIIGDDRREDFMSIDSDDAHTCIYIDDALAAIREAKRDPVWEAAVAIAKRRPDDPINWTDGACECLTALIAAVKEASESE